MSTTTWWLSWGTSSAREEAARVHQARAGVREHLARYPEVPWYGNPTIPGG
jgi:hypothetical protein